MRQCKNNIKPKAKTMQWFFEQCRKYWNLPSFSDFSNSAFSLAGEGMSSSASVSSVPSLGSRIWTVKLWPSFRIVDFMLVVPVKFFFKIVFQNTCGTHKLWVFFIHGHQFFVDLVQIIKFQRYVIKFMDNDLTTWKTTSINFNFVVVEQQKPTKIGIPRYWWKHI